jgi:hypothetical protein
LTFACVADNKYLFIEGKLKRNYLCSDAVLPSTGPDEPLEIIGLRGKLPLVFNILDLRSSYDAPTRLRVVFRGGTDTPELNPPPRTN